jgi:hypothetical protein
VSVLLLPDRFYEQPQESAVIAEEFAQYNPRIVVLPAVGVNLSTNAGYGLGGSVARVNGGLNFPGGASDRIDLGSEVVFSPTLPCTIVMVTRIASFPSSYPSVAGLVSSDGHNVTLFYSNSGAYADISIGSSFTNGQGFFLTPFGSVTGTWHKVVITYDGSNSYLGFKIFCNGLQLAKNGANTIGDTTGNNILGMSSAFANPFLGDIQTFQFYKGLFPDALALQVSENPWMVFQDQPRMLAIASTTSGINLVGAASTQVNPSSTGAISQTHILIGAASTQVNPSSTGSISIGSVNNLIGAASTQANPSSSGAITVSGINNLVGAASTQANPSGTGAITQIQILIGAASVQVNLSSSGSISGTTTLVGAASTQVNLGSSGAITIADIFINPPGAGYVWRSVASNS